MSERKTLSVIEAAEWLGIGRTKAYELIQQDRFPVRVIRLGKRLLISRAELERYLSGGAALLAQTYDPPAV